MHTLPLANIDALFLDAGNTLVGMDLALVCERLARHRTHGRQLRGSRTGVEASPACAE